MGSNDVQEQVARKAAEVDLPSKPDLTKPRAPRMTYEDSVRYIKAVYGTTLDALGKV